MHGIHQTDALLDPTFLDHFLNRVSDVDKPTTVWNFKQEMLGQTFHIAGMHKAEIIGNEELTGQ